MCQKGYKILENPIRIPKRTAFVLPLFLLVAVPVLVQLLFYADVTRSLMLASPMSITTPVFIGHYSSKNYQLIINRRRANHVPFMVKADPFRDSNKIRPSLHPITINILAQALKLRASSMLSKSRDIHSSNDLSSTPLTKEDEIVWSDQPLDIVMTVSTIAAKAIQQRQKTSSIDQMTFTVEEQQAITGRVVGVMVRLKSLQHLLYTKCSNVAYVQKYNEWHSFGLLEPHNVSSNSETESKRIADDEMDVEQQRILCSDPLLLLNRAECLLALFIHTIEIPELQSKNCTVPDQSKIDFLDDDRQQVLMN